MSEISGGGSNEGTSSGTEMDNSAEVGSSVETGGATEMNGANEVGTSSETNGVVEIGSAKETSGNEIAINPEQTSHGMNQILETPTTLEQAQISVEHFHNQSIAQILDMNGKYISEADRGRIEDGVNSIKAIEHNPNSGRSGKAGKIEGSILVCISVAILSSVSVAASFLLLTLDITQYIIISDIRMIPYWAASPKLPPIRTNSMSGKMIKVNAAAFWLNGLWDLSIIIAVRTATKKSSIIILLFIFFRIVL